MSLSIVLPCFNEEGNIEQVVDDVLGWMKEDSITGEIIVVDDGSRDQTPAILARIAADHPVIRIVRHEKNRGYGLAVRAGCDAASRDTIVFMDSDGQFRAKDISKLLPLLEDADFVTGRRRKRADTFIRNMFGKVLGAWNVLVLGLWVRDVNCGLKAFRKSLWPRIRPVHGVEKLFNTEMFLRLKRQGIPWKQIDVPHYPRLAGSPTGAKISVILRMFKEAWHLRTHS